MVRDNAPFYDPLGLVSEGTKIDFQLQINSYLYGTRFMTWLAHTLLAREAGRVGAAAGGQPRATTPASSGTSSAARSSDAWRPGSPASATSSRRTSTAIRKYPITPYRDVSRARARLGLARLLRREAGQALRGLQLSRASSRTSASIDVETGDARAARRHQGAGHLHGDVARLRSRRRGSCSTRPTTARIATSSRSIRRPRKTEHAAEGRAHRRSRLQPRRPDALGHPAPERHRHAGADRSRPTRSGTRSTRSPTARWSTTSTSRRTARGCRRRSARSTGKQDVRVLRRPSRLLAGDVDAGGAVRLRAVGAHPASCSRRDGTSPVRQLLLHRRVEHLPLRHRDRRTSRR